MNCMKCGNIIAADQVFCEDCLTEMASYPVDPETPVILPPRSNSSKQKRVSTRRVRKPEEVIVIQRNLILTLLVLLLAVSVALCMVISTLTQILQVPDGLPDRSQPSTSQAAD